MVNSTAVHLKENDIIASSSENNSILKDYAHKIHLKNLAYAEECGDRGLETNLTKSMGYQAR